MLMHTIQLKDESDTLILGQSLAEALRTGDFVALTGDLGAGKTTLARGLITSLVGETEVPSPTYTLVQTYNSRDMEIWHCDLYRLEAPEDVFELGLMDVLDDIVCLVEWPERLGGYLPKDRLTIDLSFAKEGRIATVSGGPSWTERMEKL